MGTIAKPFLKWAGGKTQLLPEIIKRLPANIKNQGFTYIEPFVGSGAVLFWMLGHFDNLERAVINDINEDLVNTYRVVAQEPYELIKLLQTFQIEFHRLENNDLAKKKYYYQKRELYNSRRSDTIKQAALFIFLNRTCFNGLYRVNKQNEFNVPMGSYKKPTICDSENLLAVNKILQKVKILCGDFENTLAYAHENTLFYCDPPYKPLNLTSSFNSYAKDEFGDAEQIRLSNFCKRLEELNHAWILSNSDVSVVESNNFFNELYGKFEIQKVNARRNINSISTKRGEVKELLITGNMAFANS
ncbi:MAG TPA: DNA adenine methylase [Turneriella sp.]|nr:DNA adenine methylase [Turneriella sp.]